ncbi:MAG TPA: ATP-binding protein [Pirellulales bacterium]|nr:ATP-binding protein [Pirellulales bacterium]
MARIESVNREMHPTIRKQALRRSVASFFFITVALVCVVLLGAWGAWRDLAEVRADLLRAETTRLRSLAERTVGRIESHLAESSSPLSKLGQADWLRAQWKRYMPRQPERLYGAVVDAAGVIVAHSNPLFEGRRIEKRWYDRAVPEAGDDVVELRSAALAGGSHGFDVSVPISFEGQAIGTYHSGLAAANFEAQLNLAYGRIVRRWTLVISGIMLVVSLAALSLYQLARRTAALERGLQQADVRHVTELSQLMMGLAHEVRNPLNAVRLNLHMIGRVCRQEDWLPAEDLAGMLHDSTQEIERVEVLIREILGFAQVESERVDDVDLAAEIRAILNFLNQSMTDDEIAVRVRMTDEPVVVRMNRSRLRQVLLNLFNNAREAAGRGGQIELTLVSTRDGASLFISDSGPGVREPERQRIFEPFYTTKPDGLGLGLPLVKKFVEDVGGEVRCEGDEQGRTRFRVWLPASRAPHARRSLV